MYSTILSGALLGVNACLVQVEVDAASGLPAMSMVGSLSGEVRESRERVWAAMKNMGLEIPPKHITVNLSPADLKKEGTAYDLPIAVGMLEALGYFPAGRARDILFLGELGLNGEIRQVRGVLPIVREAAKIGVREFIVPKENAGEGAVIPDVKVRGAATMGEVLGFLMADAAERGAVLPAQDTAGWTSADGAEGPGYDFAEVKGQEMAKRAAKIAAAGFHNLLMIGTPGAGKSMIAKRIPGILPPLTLEESLEVTSVYSVAGNLDGKSLLTKRPFQAPHHTISMPALMGGGAVPRPGVISLAHRGVLFLDELAEFPRVVLDGLRQPLEDRRIQIARVGGNLIYPSDFMLVCAMNPCPCGFYPDRGRCRCTEPQIRRYTGKISGPILDRMDLCTELQAVDISSLHRESGGETSAQIRGQVERARRMQEERFQGMEYRFNGDVRAADIDRFCPLEKEDRRFMEETYAKMGLSARSYHRVRKVARTIADLAGEERIRREHLLEAVLFRPAQEYWK